MPIPDLDMTVVNVAQMCLWVSGTLVGSIHTGRTVRRWRATVRTGAPRRVRATAFWFFRQNVGHLILGTSMSVASLIALDHVMAPAIHVLTLCAALAFAITKAWNLYADEQIEQMIARRHRAEQGR